ncbi:MAG: hypothetical protein QOD84_1013 [Acidobacteriaceae bacterium]|jgi:hypothetical protein
MRSVHIGTNVESLYAVLDRIESGRKWGHSFVNLKSSYSKTKNCQTFVSAAEELLLDVELKLKIFEFASVSRRDCDPRPPAGTRAKSRQEYNLRHEVLP